MSIAYKFQAVKEHHANLCIVIVPLFLQKRLEDHMSAGRYIFKITITCLVEKDLCLVSKMFFYVYI